nr:GNAT family N-acetyltransferase [Candidatus Sigynarchaeota archaeon]
MDNLIVRTFDPGDEQGVNEVMRKAFKSPNANAYPFPPSRFIVVAELDGAIVGHTTLRPMMFYVAGKKIPGNVLHMVATDPAQQKKGIGHAVLDRVIEISEREGQLVSVLETPVPRFYGLKGWEIIGDRKELVISKASLGESKDLPPGMEIADGNKDHVQVYAGLRERFARQFTLFAAGNVEYFQRIYEFVNNGSIVNFFHEIRLNGKIAGYVGGSRDADVKEGEPLKVTIREIVLDQVSDGILVAILRHLLSFDDEFQAVSINFPVSKEIEAVLLARGVKSRDPGGNKDMVRVNSVDGVINALGSEIGAGLSALVKQRKGTRAEDIAIDVDGQRVLVQCGKETCKAAKIDGTVAVKNQLSIIRNAFAWMVLGIKTPSDLVKSGAARCNPASILPQLDAMFPKRLVVLNYYPNFYQAHLKEMGIK